MAYKLVITEHAEALLDRLVDYLMYHIKSEQAARHLLDSLESIYSRLENNPEQFPLTKDTYLAKKGYREAVVLPMKYIAVFDIQGDTVYLVGVFHQLENYEKKL